MPRDTATRRFQLTFNNPKEHDYSHEKIKSLLEAGGKIGYWCMGDEIGTQKLVVEELEIRKKSGNGQITARTSQNGKKITTIEHVKHILSWYLLAAPVRLERTTP